MKQIYEIFSRRKIKTEEKRTNEIIADYREKSSLVISEIINLGIKINFKELKVADYIINDIAIERKTISDFTSSMLNRRLINQLKGLQQYKNRLLIIEGTEERELYAEENMGIHPNSIRGFLISILLKYRVPIIFTKNSEDTARFISVLTKRKEKELSLNVSKNSLNKKERIQFILESFPGIGPKTARKLLEKFKTLKGIFNADQEELEETIGKKSEIFRIINEEY